MKEKGFTLVELLAVIVILSIIAMITIPMIKGVIDKVKLGSLEDSVYGLKKAAEIYYSSNGKIETTEFICTDNGCISNTGKKLDYKGRVEGKVKLFSDGKVSICLTDDNYASSILASDKKATTKMGGCDEETYEISEVIAIEKYNEINAKYSKLETDFNNVKTSLYNKQLISSLDISNEDIVNEIDNLNLNEFTEERRQQLVQSLAHSGLGVTSETSFEDITMLLSNFFTENLQLISNGVLLSGYNAITSTAGTSGNPDPDYYMVSANAQSTAVSTGIISWNNHPLEAVASTKLVINKKHFKKLKTTIAVTEYNANGIGSMEFRINGVAIRSFTSAGTYTFEADLTGYDNNSEITIELRSYSKGGKNYGHSGAANWNYLILTVD